MIVVRQTVTDDPMGFSITVREGNGQTQHEVTMGRATYQKLTNGNVSPTACIEAAFNFLLEREPKESILSRFDITTIATYFPSFERDFPRYMVGKE
ncbi:MAG: hypothetical protein WA970_16880 [Gammaproteobacteria bacterium]|jgi:hypothetical protein